MNNDLFVSRWDWRKLIIYNLFAAILIVTWLWQPSHQLWDSLDAYLFHLLNAPLAKNPTWAVFWAINNMRPVDIGVGLILLGIIIQRDWIFAAHQIRRALLAFLAILFLMLLARIGFVEILKSIGWSRESPSLSIHSAVRLTALFSDWEAHWYLKDSSIRSFPGDHASVLLIWAMLLSACTQGKKLILIWLLALFFMLPRLVAGAHWASDDLVGGVFISLIAFGWGYYSPYAVKASAFLEWLFAPVFRLLAKIPLINKLSVISG